ncbi:hypothetical protein FN846DRAFT_925451 [Sphaerosporella brunnea]|uniref:Transcription factor TFIIB cyclin-like domain-containing protein n=1 Tax=Sphaerosporella brunnea TaxID=1250544 RepID=A0A5J5FC40_9PEZI|nr:hypothetical protein FN846DRAFT_925451 [Sphaerosporella brunnea]
MTLDNFLTLAPVNSAATLHCPEHFIDQAQRWFTLAITNNFTRGRKSLYVIACCHYIACRIDYANRLLGRPPDQLFHFTPDVPENSDCFPAVRAIESEISSLINDQSSSAIVKEPTLSLKAFSRTTLTILTTSTTTGKFRAPSLTTRKSISKPGNVSGPSSIKTGPAIRRSRG